MVILVIIFFIFFKINNNLNYNTDTIGSNGKTCNDLNNEYGYYFANCIDPTNVGTLVNSWRFGPDGNLWKIVVADIGCLSTSCQNQLKGIGYTSNYYYSSSTSNIVLSREVCDKAYFDTHKGEIQSEYNTPAPVPPFNDD
jgi:hypothetical protein